MLSHNSSSSAIDAGVLDASKYSSEETLDTSLNTNKVQQRANIYRFLSTAFLQPVTQEFVDGICNIDVLDDLASVFGEAAIKDLRGYAEQVDMDVTDLVQEYMDLFSVPTSRYVTPLEDVYFGMQDDGDEKIHGPLLGERAVIAQQIYRAAGAEMLESRSELPNHIGIELAFMSFLVEKEALLESEFYSGLSDTKENRAALAAYQKIQRQFLKYHLMSWYPKLNRAIQENTRTRFYQGLAQFAEIFFRWDAKYLKKLAIADAMETTHEGMST